MKATPITQRAKSTPFKMNQGLVDGARDVYRSKTTGFEEKEEAPVATENNQQPLVPTTGEDGGLNNNKEKTKEHLTKKEQEAQDLKIKNAKKEFDFQEGLSGMGGGKVPGSTLGTVHLS